MTEPNETDAPPPPPSTLRVDPVLADTDSPLGPVALVAFQWGKEQAVVPIDLAAETGLQVLQAVTDAETEQLLMRFYVEYINNSASLATAVVGMFRIFREAARGRGPSLSADQMKELREKYANG
jgi:hypothetical protein